MESQDVSPSALLLAEYQKRKMKNAAFSLRAFARQLGIPAGRLSQYFAGKRVISTKIARRLSERMAFAPEHEEQFMKVVQEEQLRKKPGAAPEAEMDYTELSADAFAVLSDWYYFAILNLIKLKDFRNDPVWIGKRLGLNTRTVTQAIQRLKRLGIVEEKGNRLVRLHKQIRTSDGLESRALRVSHEQSLNQAIDALHNVDIDLRDITSITMAIVVNRIPAAKKIIKNFRRRLSAYLEAGEKNEVYNLNVQLVPVTKVMQHGGPYEH